MLGPSLRRKNDWEYPLPLEADHSFRYNLLRYIYINNKFKTMGGAKIFCVNFFFSTVAVGSKFWKLESYHFNILNQSWEALFP